MKITKVLLAAGESSRFGQCKLVQPIGNSSIIEKAVNTLNSLDDELTYVIGGAWHDEVCKALTNFSNVKVLYNPNWPKGLGNSIAFAANELGVVDRAFLFVLADQVALNCTDLKELISGFRRQPTRWCARYDKRLGVPAIFPPEDNDLLRKLEGEHGAKKLLRDTRAQIHFVDMSRASFDIDTPDDLATARRLFSSGLLEADGEYCD